MRTPRVGVVALVCAALSLPACGGGSTASTPDPGPPSARDSATSAATQDGAPEEAARAVSVRLVISGGLGGSRRVYEVTREGAQSRGAAKALDVASSGSLRRYTGEQLVGPAPCCDLRVYDVTIRYADGETTRVRTAQTLDTTPELSRVITLVTQEPS